MQAILIFIIGSLAAGVAGLAWFWLFRPQKPRLAKPLQTAANLHRWDAGPGYRR